MTTPKPSPLPPPPQAPPPRRGKSLGVIIIFLLLVALLPFGLFAAMVAPGPLAQDKTVIIPHGSSVREVAAVLAQNDAIYNALAFRIAAKIFTTNDLKAGEYLFPAHASASDIALVMHEGKSVMHMFTLAEGLTSAEAVRLLKADPVLTGDLATVPPDGSLLPETYRYSYGDTRASMIARMQKAMQEMTTSLWATRDASIPVQTAWQAVVMASIVEKETRKPAERPRIAGVFYNRLRHSMRLQSDPTVIYALLLAKGGLDHTLTRSLDHDDLTFPSPYNTYMSDGLPPAPICNPGRAAVEAALHPEANDFYYFVADGSGGHVFAHDLAEHNQNVTRWNQVKPKP